MIKVFDNYIHLNQASMLNYGARYRASHTVITRRVDAKRFGQSLNE
jgi:hypothetical protein